MAKIIAVILKPCPFCRKDIPRSITVCPYCHRDEKGKHVQIDPLTGDNVRDIDRLSPNDLDHLAHRDAFVREEAVTRIAKGGVGAVGALVNILQEFNKPGMVGIVKILGKIGDRRAIPALVRAAKLGDEDLRMAAVWALSQFREPEILPVLLNEVERPHSLIQSYLAQVLGSFQDPRVPSVLNRLIQHPQREVAFQAAWALGDLGDRQAAAALRRGARRRDVVVREASLAALKRLGLAPVRWSWLWWVLGLSLFVAAAVVFRLSPH
jgi:HEAT repeat protein